MDEKPDDNPERIKVLNRLALLDLPPDASWDRFTRLASHLLGVPVSLISLVDRDRQFFLSQIGLNEPYASQRETPLSHSFCQYTIQNTQPFVVDNAREHPLVKNNLAIPDLNIIAYLGIPLRTQEGVALGAFCAIDNQPHNWSDNDISVMTDLAAAVMTEIELRSEIAKRQRAEQALLDEHKLFVSGPMITLKWTRDDTWRVSYVSANIKEQLGYNADDFITGKTPYASIVHPDDLERVTMETQLYADAGYPDFEQEYRLRRSNGEYRWFFDYTMILRDDVGQPKYYQGYIRDITPQKQLERTLYQATARLRSIADTQAAYIVRIDLVGNYTYVNKRFEDMYAWMQTDKVNLVGLVSLNTIAPEDHDKVREVVEQCLKAPGKPFQVTLRKVTQTEELHYALWEFVAIADNQGVPSEIQCVGFDVTQQVLAQDALTLSESRYKLITDLMTDFVVSVEVKPDGELAIEWRTGAYEQITGFSTDVRTDSAGKDLVHPDDLPKMREEVNRTLAGERTTSEYRRRHKDGHFIWIYAERLPIWDETEQRVVRYYIAERDITKRKLIEQDLQKANERQAALLQAIPDLMFRIREDGTYLDYHAPSRDMLYVPPDDFIGKKIGQLFSEETTRYLLDNVRQVVSTKQSMQLEYSAEVDNRTIYFEARVAPLGQDEVVVLVRDISERKQSEKLVLLQNSALQAAANAIVITNRERGVEWVNSAFTKMTGYTLEDMQDQTIVLNSRADENRESLAEEILKTIDDGKVWFGITSKRRKDGTTYREEQTITPVRNAEGSITHYISVRQDITEREKESELLIEQQRLRINLAKEQELNTMIQKAVSSLAHDVRTPLAVISTTKDLLTHYYDSMDESKRRQKLNSIEKQLYFVTDMLDDLVEFVKSNLSARSFHPTPVNLSTLCSVTVKELQETLGRQHRLVFTCDSETNTVRVDETLVNRIVLNLVSNAIKFSPVNSDVRLELHHYPHEIVIKVTDYGIGISETDQQHIFEAFYRAESAATIAGTGLGLNIVMDCVQQHSGTIRVESRVNEGSTFIVTLPIEEVT